MITMTNQSRNHNYTDPGSIEITVIEPREPSIEFIRDMLDEAEQKLTEFYNNKDATPREINNEYFWIKQQLTDLIIVNNMLKKKETDEIST